MKIGILTLPLHRNYGGIMQAWALQQVLKRLGHESELINLSNWNRPGMILCALRALSLAKCIFKKFLLRQKDVYIHSILYQHYNPKEPQYADNKFVRRGIRKTRLLTSDTNIEKFVDNRRYEAIIVGSDQVWREESYYPSILHYFLDFLPKDDHRIKIAYAASFGKSQNYISADKIPYCRELLHYFNSVSVREYEGLDFLEKDFGFFRGKKVLDPTLLLSSEDYKHIIANNEDKQEAHIAAYILDPTEDKDTILSKISSKLNIPCKAFSCDFHGKKMLTVPQWLEEFCNADYIVTDSFHGCIFSIIFHKPFVAIANKARGLSRFVSLLSDFGLNNRLVSDIEEFEIHKDLLLIEPNYKEVDHKLDILREDSIKFLSSSLGFNHCSKD